MANRNRDSVHINVNSTFFDKIFEPERKSLQKKLGIELTQKKFTEYLARSNAQIKYPKMDNIFGPDKRRKGKFLL